MKQELSYQHDLTVIAGQCSCDKTTLDQAGNIAEISIEDAKGVKRTGVVDMVRLVGMKSRTVLDEAVDVNGEGQMGMDWPLVQEILLMSPHDQTEALQDMILPSAELAKKIIKNTGMGVATEVMIPHIQLPSWERAIPSGKALLWNPSVNQLGWPVYETTLVANRHGWSVGIKNGKTLGSTLEHANTVDHKETSMEKMWTGLASYAKDSRGTVLIHRGVDVPEKGNYRNALVHEVARRVKKKTGAALFFDPSHSLGPKLRNQIVTTTIEIMHMKDGNNWLYDGILIEAGSSRTDTDQHITIDELGGMLGELARFRNLKQPERVPLPKSGVIYACS